MKTGDLEPAWAVEVSDLDGVADFGDVTSWRFTAYRQTGNGPVVVFTDNNPSKVVAGSSAVVTHLWVAGETDVAGVLHADVVAVWPDDREQTFSGARLPIEPSAD